uniref:Uncharacterized protein n=1 Tax=Cacopsylla melanoneura TaxID=428564 RepID=A0A8D8V4L1_9HEMI
MMFGTRHLLVRITILSTPTKERSILTARLQVTIRMLLAMESTKNRMLDLIVKSTRNPSTLSTLQLTKRMLELLAMKSTKNPSTLDETVQVIRNLLSTLETIR